MQNRAEILLDETMTIYVENELTRARVDYITEKRVLDTGEIITSIAYDGCDPYVGNYIFHAGATFYKEMFLNMQKSKL